MPDAPSNDSALAELPLAITAEPPMTHVYSRKPWESPRWPAGSVALCGRVKTSERNLIDYPGLPTQVCAVCASLAGWS